MCEYVAVRSFNLSASSDPIAAKKGLESTGSARSTMDAEGCWKSRRGRSCFSHFGGAGDGELGPIRPQPALGSRCSCVSNANSCSHEMGVAHLFCAAQ